MKNKIKKILNCFSVSLDFSKTLSIGFNILNYWYSEGIASKTETLKGVTKITFNEKGVIVIYGLEFYVSFLNITISSLRLNGGIKTPLKFFRYNIFGGFLKD